MAGNPLLLACQVSPVVRGSAGRSFLLRLLRPVHHAHRCQVVTEQERRPLPANLEPRYVRFAWHRLGSLLQRAVVTEPTGDTTTPDQAAAFLDLPGDGAGPLLGLLHRGDVGRHRPAAVHGCDQPYYEVGLDRLTHPCQPRLVERSAILLDKLLNRASVNFQNGGDPLKKLLADAAAQLKLANAAAVLDDVHAAGDPS